jgi:quercetin dioxygenase-like cupin family protein
VAQTEGEEVLFCGCKHSRDQPFCDGAHNDLRETYEEDDPHSADNARIPVVAADGDGKARLDGGCFVFSLQRDQLETRGTLKYCSVISRADGALHQSQFYLEADTGESPVVGFGGRHVILFIAEGAGEVSISGQRFTAAPGSGLHVRPGEAFQLVNDSGGALRVFAAVCPQADGPAWHDSMPENFDDAYPDRAVAMNPDSRQTMADRYFQLLVDKRIGSDVATQFVGEIPISKAMPHRHLYEESLVIMSGAGFMWTDAGKAPVAAGDVIFLPRKQVHSLECTDPGGMMVMGVIYPGDNPSINY